MEDGDIRVDVQNVDGVIIATLAGELDFDTAARLDAALDRVPLEENLVLDLAGLELLDSSGLVVILRQRTRRDYVGGTLHIRRPSIRVRSWLKIRCVDHLLAETDLPSTP